MQARSVAALRSMPRCGTVQDPGDASGFTGQRRRSHSGGGRWTLFVDQRTDRSGRQRPLTGPQLRKRVEAIRDEIVALGGGYDLTAGVAACCCCSRRSMPCSSAGLIRVSRSPKISGHVVPGIVWRTPGASACLGAEEGSGRNVIGPSGCLQRSGNAGQEDDPSARS